MASPSSKHARGPLLGGKYRLSELLGRGGMGAVYEGRHVRTGRPVAVKILHGDYAGNAEVVRRFLREARALAELDHPNVVDVLDMDEESDGTVYMVLERLEGESLAAHLAREKALPFERAAAVLLPVMRALAFAHGRGVVHRDLKPENIFLHHDAEGKTVPKVLDFGIAWALEEDARPRITQNGYVMGTPEYMSPEQAEGVTERIGAPTDVWAMGVLWYEALTGALPFAGATAHEVMAAVSRAPFQLPSARLPHLPAEVARVLDRALSRDVSARFADMDAFLDALLRAMERPATSVPPEENTDPTPILLGDARRKGPSNLALVSLVAAIAGVLTTAGFLARGPDPVHTATRAAIVAPARPRPAPFRAPVAPDAPIAHAAVAAPPVAAPPAAPPPAIALRPTPRPPVVRARRGNDSPAVAPRRPRDLPRPNAPLTDYDSLP